MYRYALACAIAASLLLVACSGGADAPFNVGDDGNTSGPSGPPIPTVPLDGTATDILLSHKALVYDKARNRYYASVSASPATNGNSIATINPATGQVSFAASIGSGARALAIAADSSALYVGLDASGDIVKLALPSLTELARTRLPLDPFNGQTRADTLAASPADPAVVAASMLYIGNFSQYAGVVLLRDMVTQQRTPQIFSPNNLLAFDTAGTTLYGLNTSNSEGGLRSNQVLADGLAEQSVIGRASDYISTAISFANNQVIVGHTLYDGPTFAPAGKVASPSDCAAQRAGGLLLCFGFSTPSAASVLLVDAGTLVIQASLVYASPDMGGRPRLVEGPAGQIAIDSTDGIRLFNSNKLVAPPAPPAPSWTIASSSTADGQALDIGLAHNSLVYDSSRNVYYASVPGSVIGAGNSIATIDPATGQVTHSAPVGSEPNALAVAADGSALYVGLDGSGEVMRLALPSMTPQGRVHLVVDPFLGVSRPEAISVSPTDATVAAASMAWVGISPRHVGVALLRDMVMQPKRTPGFSGSNLHVFDSAGTTLYGLDLEQPGIRRISVLPDGLAEELVVPSATDAKTRALSFANGRAIAGAMLYDAPALTLAGTILGATDCWPARTGAGLLCLSNQQGRVLVANSTTFVIGVSLTYAPSDPDTPRRLVPGPSGQIAISYVPASAPPSIRLFTSAQIP